MQIGKIIRRGLGWTFPVWFVLIALNVEKLTERLGLDTVLADAAAPKTGASPMLEYITQPWILTVSLIAIGVAAGVWIDTGLRSIDARRANNRWWDGMKSFSIERAACLMAGIMPKNYAGNERAKGIADELIGLVRAGQIPTNMEPSIYTEEALDNADFAPNEPLYKSKPSAGLDTVIARKQIESFSKSRGYSLPWQR